MHAGIGATRAHQINRMICNFSHRLAQFGLDSSDPGFLVLPAMKILAIVFEGQRHPAIANGVIRGQYPGLLKQGFS
jgi:hypothetical protein